MTELERGLLLLCSDLGDETVRPLTFAQYRSLRKTIRAASLEGSDPDSAVNAASLIRLGCTPDDAENILRLLDREAQLDRYLKTAAEYGILAVTQWSPSYPVHLLQSLEELAPPVLFALGDPTLFRRPCVSLVGSRKLLPSGEQFASRVGECSARAGLTLVSGGAVGADSVGQGACLSRGGSVISFVPTRLVDYAKQPPRKGLLLCSETGFSLPFTAQRALSRNRLIHGMGQRTFVAQVAAGTGGTFRGTMENLSHNWSPVFVHADGSPGAALLRQNGATPVTYEQLNALF